MYSGQVGKYRSEEARKERECPACYGTGRKRYSTSVCEICDGHGLQTSLIPPEQADGEIEQAILRQLRADATMEIREGASQREIAEVIRRRGEARVELSRRTGQASQVIQEMLEAGMEFPKDARAKRTYQGGQTCTGEKGTRRNYRRVLKYMLVVLLPFVLALLALVVIRSVETRDNPRRIEGR